MIQIDTKIFKITAIALVVAGLTSCNAWVQSGFGVTQINDIETNWQKYSKVYVRGTVKQVVPFVGSAAYELEDSTGNIWVFIQKVPPPDRGEEILIKGQVKYQSIPIADIEFGEVYVEQIKQLELNEESSDQIENE